jgi:UDP-N-acetylmuramyl pentapeptide phosphotransferase/UDP-N-acetylglucosamine-1-phosphate transferase
MTDILIFLLITIFLTFLSRKLNLLPNFTGENHQYFLKEKKIPLIGGILFLISSINLFYEKNLIFCFIILTIFIIGFLSDNRIINSPKIRIFFQSLVIFIAVYSLDIQISSTRISILDKLIDIKIFGIIFCVFCLMILINGSNFVDGLNGLLLGYCLIILFILAKSDLLYLIQIEEDLLLFFFLSIVIMLFFNFFNLFYLGDGGSYSIGLVLGFLLISIYNFSNNISPFFIILLLWYPCFENLFSILRKNKFKNSPIVADDKHFHQLLFFYIKKRFLKNTLFSNNCSSILINFYNLLVMLIATSDIYSSNFQTLLIILNILVYCIIYRYLFIYRFSKK